MLRALTISGVPMPKVSAAEEEEGYRRCDELAAEQRPNLDDVDFATAQALGNLLV
jgi:hypothetical protein